MNLDDNRNDTRRDTANDTNLDNSSKEPDRHTEIEQPNPSIGTPNIPAEMPVREIR